MTVEVAFAAPTTQVIIETRVPPGSSVEEAIRASGVLVRFPQIDLRCNKVGVFGKRAALSDTLQPGDRVEIYRPLAADPKESRKRRARKA